MDQVVDFILKMLMAEAWPPRWKCDSWTDFHGWLYICSSLAIWAAYFTIPLSIFCLIRKKKDEIAFVRILWLFIIFIFSCGLTHLTDAIIFWYPVYRLSAIALFLTALVSWIAAIAIFKAVPLALTLKSRRQLEQIVIERTALLEKSNNTLEHRELMQR